MQTVVRGRNPIIIRNFRQIASLIQVEGGRASGFRAGAYTKAANHIECMTTDIADADLESIPGFGDSIVGSIHEMLASDDSKSQRLRDLESKHGAITELLLINGVGPAKAKSLFSKGYDSVKAVKQAVEKGKVTDKRIVEHFTNPRKDTDNGGHLGNALLVNKAIQMSEDIVDRMESLFPEALVAYAGSARRMGNAKGLVGDLDILIAGPNKEDYCNFFRTMSEVSKVEFGKDSINRVTVILADGTQADLKTSDRDPFYFLLMHCTGSAGFNALCRQRAKKMGYKLNEYGFFDRQTGESIMVKADSEEQIFEKLGIPYITPVVRDSIANLDNVPQQLKGLLEYCDINADYHQHVTWSSDGRQDIAEFAQYGWKRGFKRYGAMTHGPRLAMDGGQKAEGLRKIKVEVDEANKHFIENNLDFRVLCGVEADLMNDGSLDVGDEGVEAVDYVILAAHYLANKNYTDLLVTAIKRYPKIQILAHASNRLVNGRGPSPLDYDKVFQVCMENNVAIEINGAPERLDASEELIRKAVLWGCKFVISSDQHGCLEASERNQRLALAIAQRAGLTKENILEF